MCLISPKVRLVFSAGGEALPHQISRKNSGFWIFTFSVTAKRQGPAATLRGPFGRKTGRE
ncbi:hypothetical protein CCGE525_29705 (plasmid) [Rhizobium jaguaris]|uniref:Uncharacterized protein n=1 Tax=Rhizobium jaguaris TaxID=1312183 RepID=A0A387G0H3_9HYPH|nr:hypothetical protein CCGE525_29705 [Rhizobium jaguaris]